MFHSFKSSPVARIFGTKLQSGEVAFMSYIIYEISGRQAGDWAKSEKPNTGEDIKSNRTGHNITREPVQCVTSIFRAQLLPIVC